MNNNTENPFRTYEADNQTNFTVNIPFDFSNSQTKLSELGQYEAVMTTLDIEIKNFADLINAIGLLLRSGDIEGSDAGEFIPLISKLQQGFLEAREQLQTGIKKIGQTVDLPENEPLDLSGSSVESLSMKLSEIMQNPLLPEKLRECLSDEIGYNFSADTADPEVIRKSLENSLKQEDDNE